MKKEKQTSSPIIRAMAFKRTLRLLSRRSQCESSNSRRPERASKHNKTVGQGLKRSQPRLIPALKCLEWDMRSSKVNFRFVVGYSASFAADMLCVGRAMATDTLSTIQVIRDSCRHLALYDVSTALEATCLPFPSLSFAFWKKIHCIRDTNGTLNYRKICGLILPFLCTFWHFWATLG